MLISRHQDYRHCRKQWHTEEGFGGSNTPHPQKFWRPSKIVPNTTWLWKLVLKIAEFRTPTPQDVRKKGSKILKLPPVHNCFTFSMTNKLVVIINSLKVPKIKKMLLYGMKFLVPNYSCLQNPWLGDYCPQIPILSVLCPQLNLLIPPYQKKKKIPGCATGRKYIVMTDGTWTARSPYWHFQAVFVSSFIHGTWYVM